MDNKKFDTQIQYIKYKVLKETAILAWKDELLEKLLDIPYKAIPGTTPTMRCCVYKERAIVAERVKLAMGDDRDESKIIKVIDIACEECPTGGYEVTNACVGCISHRCIEVCKFGAINFDHRHVAHIDKSKCKECGACSKVCPFSAIIHRKRPCENACKIKAISMNENKAARIKYEKCINCGACVKQCPFGAINDKSFILDAVDLLKKSENNTNYKVYLIVAPSIATQFSYAKVGQAISASYKVGFYDVVEAAWGADLVTEKETKELVEKGRLLSSCCPSFVLYIEKNFPELIPYISTNVSPMVEIAKVLKRKDPTCKVVFAGPCISKKVERTKENVRDYIDVVLTFEELQALFGSKAIDIKLLEETPLKNASVFGRLFARSGGLAEAVKQSIIENNYDFELKASVCNGIEECKNALKSLKNGTLIDNFIEGMACNGGCIGGPGCLKHETSHLNVLNKHAASSEIKNIKDSIKENE